MEWDLVSFNRLQYNVWNDRQQKYVLTYFPFYDDASVRIIADYAGGTVMTIKDYADSVGISINLINGLFSYPEDLIYNRISILIPDNSPYALFFYTGQSSGASDARIYAFKLGEYEPLYTSGYSITAHYVGGSIPWVASGEGSYARAFRGDGFAIFTSLASVSSSYQGWFAFDTCSDIVHGNTPLCVLSGSSVFDLENELLTTDRWYASRAFTGGDIIVQNDGTLFCELMNYVAKYNPSGYENLYFAEHIYRSYYDYSEEEKAIEVNGVEFCNMKSSNRTYFPTE